MAWSSWGKVDPLVITKAATTSEVPYSFRIARRGTWTLLASDGLGEAGLGVEVFVITSAPIEDIPSSWLFALVAESALMCVESKRIRAAVDRFGIYSAELFDIPIPEKYQAKFLQPDKRVGVLMGQKVDDVPAAVGDIKLVNVQLLLLDELQHAIADAEKARANLVKRFAAKKITGVSTVVRPSVLV